MGCNVCMFNRGNFLEKEFIYPDNGDNENEENSQDNENINVPENNNDNETKDKDKEKNKEIISNQIKPINSQINSEKKSSPSKLEEKNNINNNNIKINKDNNNNSKNIIIENPIIKINNTPQKLDIMKDNKENKNILKSTRNEEKKDKEEKEEKMTNKNNVSVSSVISASKKNDYNTRIVEYINKLRTNPKEYAKFILSNMQYIYKRVKIIADDLTGQNEEKVEYYFKKKVKVELYKGEIAFIEAAKFLSDLNPLNELEIKEEIKINILPEKEEEINNDKIFIKNQLNEIKKKFNVSAFFKDNVKNPEIGLMLMIIGDYKNSQNKKRNALLNPDYKYIAVNSKFIGDKFVSYFTFSK